MDKDINQPIVKETSIIQGCSTGHHLFSGDKSMMGVHNGILELRMKCSLCGVEIAEPMPGLGASIPPGTMPVDDGTPPPEQTLERGVPIESTREPEQEVKFEEPLEEIRQRPFADPPWAQDIRNRYKQDKGLDDFWGDVWDKAKSGK